MLASVGVAQEFDVRCVVSLVKLENDLGGVLNDKWQTVLKTIKIHEKVAKVRKNCGMAPESGSDPSDDQYKGQPVLVLRRSVVL